MTTITTTSTIAALRLRADGILDEVTVSRDTLLSDMYRLIGCSVIEPVDLTSEVTMWLDEEGMLTGVPANLTATRAAGAVGLSHQLYYGTAIFTGGTDRQGETLPLSAAGRAWLLAVIGRLSFPRARCPVRLPHRAPPQRRLFTGRAPASRRGTGLRYRGPVGVGGQGAAERPCESSAASRVEPRRTPGLSPSRGGVPGSSAPARRSGRAAQPTARGATPR